MARTGFEPQRSSRAGCIRGRRAPTAAGGRAVLGATLASFAALACASPPPPEFDSEAAAVMEAVDAGLAHYEAGDFTLAGRRFHEAARGASRRGDDDTELLAITSECTSWLRARELDNFAQCTQRLDKLYARRGRSDPGVNTLLVLGALAGERPLPPYRVPNAVRPYLYATNKESR